MSIAPDNFDLTADQMARLAHLAKEAGRPVPEVFDAALAAYRPPATQPGFAGESFYDVASRLGLIGSIKGTPPDLSTNKLYMEGFGQRDS